MVSPIFSLGTRRRVRLTTDTPAPEKGSPKVSIGVCGKLVTWQSLDLESSDTYIFSIECHILCTHLPVCFKHSLGYAA